MSQISISQSITVDVNRPVSYLQPFTCELQYAPGKFRPEVFYLDRNTQPGQTLVINRSFIRVIERLEDTVKR